MAVYPMTYAPPVYAFPPKPARTPQGLRWMNIAFIVYIAYVAMSLLTALIAYTWLASLTSLTPANIDQALGGIAALCGALLVGVVLGILVLVFGFMGYGYVYGGRNEFGPGHAHNVQVALYMLIAAMIAWFVGLVVGQVFSGLRTSITGGITIDAGSYYLAAAVSAVTGVIVAALMAAFLVLSVRGLARPSHEGILYTAAALGTATPGITGAVTLLLLPRYISALQAFFDAAQAGTTLPPLFGAEQGIPAGVGAILAFVTILLFFLVYRDIGLRIRSGELKPVLPTPPPYTGWIPAPVVPPPAAPMWQPAPPVPPAQPPVQPPTQPPGQGPAP